VYTEITARAHKNCVRKITSMYTSISSSKFVHHGESFEWKGFEYLPYIGTQADGGTFTFKTRSGSNWK